MASTGSSTSGTTTTGSEIISSVNQSGSGIDLKSLVTGLVNAETSVAQSQITKKVENTNLSISSFGTLSSRMNTLNTELTNLEETNARATTSSNSGVVLTVTDEANAVDVNSSIVVSTLARGQAVSFDLTNNGFSNAFSNSSSRTASSSIDQGTMVFTLGSTATTITINSTNNTLQGLVDEVNKITGVQATLIDTDGSGSISFVKGLNNYNEVTGNFSKLDDMANLLGANETDRRFDFSQLENQMVTFKEEFETNNDNWDPEEAFQEWDTNGDGYVSIDKELCAVYVGKQYCGPPEYSESDGSGDS